MRKYISDKLAVDLREAGLHVHTVNYINMEPGNSKTTRKKRHIRTEEEDKKVRKWHKSHPDDSIAFMAGQFDFSAATINRILEEV